MSKRAGIIDAIDRLFGDTSQAPSTTLDDLEHIAEHTASLIETLKETFSADELE